MSSRFFVYGADWYRSCYWVSWSEQTMIPLRRQPALPRDSAACGVESPRAGGGVPRVKEFPTRQGGQVAQSGLGDPEPEVRRRPARFSAATRTFAGLY